jgi:hypothetical protein
LNTLFSFFTGTPRTVLSGYGLDTSGTAEFADRAEVVGNPFSNVPASDRATSTYYWFNPAAFAEPAQGTYSNEGRNEFYGHPTHQIDFSVFKNFGITEHITAQFRAEILEHLQFRELLRAGQPGERQQFRAGHLPGSAPLVLATRRRVG